MMIEVVVSITSLLLFMGLPPLLTLCVGLQPFFHILATSIAREIGEDKPYEVMATTLVAYALSSLLTGRPCCPCL